MYKKFEKSLSNKAFNTFQSLLQEADVNNLEETNNEGVTIIQLAAYYDQVQSLKAIYKFLRRYDRHHFFSKQDNSGMTALHWSVVRESKNACKFLLKKFPDLIKVYDNKHYLALNLIKDIDTGIQFKQLALADQPISEFVGIHMTTHRNYLQNLSIGSSPLTESECYFRSDKHPMVHRLNSNTKIFYLTNKKIKLKDGMKAHVGSYGNLMQLYGDRFKGSQSTPTQHSSDAILYNALLYYRNNVCDYIVKNFNQSNTNFLIEVIHTNAYPCVLVYIPRVTIIKFDETKNPSDSAFESWVNLLLSCYMGLLNYAAYKNGIPIEIERRAGFGPLTPTGAVTGDSFRLNVGIIPEEYADLIAEILIELNNFLANLSADLIELPEIPQNSFYGSNAHLCYLKQKNCEYYFKNVDNIMHLLWEQVEKTGKVTVNSMMRTTYARDGIAAAMFRACREKAIEEAFMDSILWAINHLQIIDDKLSFKKQGKIYYPARFEKQPYESQDKKFWNLINLMTKKIGQFQDLTLHACIAQITLCRKSRDLQDLFYYLTLSQEIIFINAALQPTNDQYGEGYGSDSEEEGVINEIPVYGKKIVTHSGMRAIWAAITVCAKRIKKDNIQIYLQAAYYEISLGIEIIQQLEGLNFIKITQEIKKADIILCDINACDTKGYHSPKSPSIKDLLKVDAHIILDTTSATTQQVHDFLSLIAIPINRRKLSPQKATLFTVESGIKHQQMGSDKNPHGIIRIFSINKDEREKYYQAVKKTEPPLLSQTSHKYRHFMKFLGATPSNHAILNPEKNIDGNNFRR